MLNASDVLSPAITDYPTSILFVQEKQTTNPYVFSDVSRIPFTGRILALDPGTKRIGVAVCDESQTISRPLKLIERKSWKKLLISVKDIIEEFDAVAVVIGLPYNFNGTESEMSAHARRMARNLSLSINQPVCLMDERVSSYTAKERLWSQGVSLSETKNLVDSEAAAIILDDFLSELNSFRNSQNK